MDISRFPFSRSGRRRTLGRELSSSHALPSLRLSRAPRSPRAAWRTRVRRPVGRERSNGVEARAGPPQPLQPGPSCCCNPASGPGPSDPAGEQRRPRGASARVPGGRGAAALTGMDVTCPGSLRLPARCLPAGLHPFQQKEHLLAVDRGWQSRRRLTGHVPGRRLRLEDRRAGLFLRTGSEAPSVFTPTCAPLS